MGDQGLQWGVRGYLALEGKNAEVQVTAFGKSLLVVGLLLFLVRCFIWLLVLLGDEFHLVCINLGWRLRLQLLPPRRFLLARFCMLQPLVYLPVFIALFVALPRLHVLVRILNQPFHLRAGIQLIQQCICRYNPQVNKPWLLL